MVNDFENFPKIISIVTKTPDNKFLQNDLLNTVLEHDVVNDEISKQVITDIYNNSKITSRYLTSLDFFNRKATIYERFHAFKTNAVEMATSISHEAIVKCNLTNKDIHKIIFVSSTGIFAPSIDIEIIKQLNLPNTIERSNILFMGCAALINAIKNASEYLNSNKNKNVLIVSCELSSVHINFSNEINNIIPHCIFSDGLSATIISSCKNNVSNEVMPDLYIIDSFNYVINNSEDGITVFMQDDSIKCKLSKNLPKYINDNILHALTLFLDKHNMDIKDIGFWAVHPGGKRILESVKNGLHLSGEQLQTSWDILENYGNMMSSSIMFVLEKFMNIDNESVNPIYCVAFSFSPGVGIEFLLLQKKYNI
jgi:alpha-pyrone synthase